MNRSPKNQGVEAAASTPAQSRRSLLSRIAEGLRITATILTVTFLLFILVNVAVIPWAPGPEDRAGAALRRERVDSALARYGMDFYRRLYPTHSEAEIKQLLYNHTLLETTYEPFVEFRMPAITTDTLNQHARGFRLLGKDQGPWPPSSEAFNVFVFGGSTTFGGGNMDAETIPAYMQALLRNSAGSDRINIYNFGAGAHFSTNEVTFLQNLLREGHRPDVVVFIDGLNDFYFWNGESAASNTLRMAFNEGLFNAFWYHARSLLTALPAVRLLQSWTAGGQVSHSGRPPFGSGVAHAADRDENDIYNARFKDGAAIKDPERIKQVIRRYLANKEIAQGVADRFGIEMVFVWQPVPLYQYDLSLHPFTVDPEHRRHRYGYPVMAEHARTHDMGHNFVWCADLGERARTTVYSDQVHYLAPFNRDIAECIVDGIKAAGGLQRAWKRKFGDEIMPARFNVSIDIKDERAAIPLFGLNGRLSHLKASRPLRDFAHPMPDGIVLVDNTPTEYASVYEEFPITSGPDTEFEVAIRIKPGTSEHVLLVLSYLGARAEHYTVAINSRTMKVVGGNGRYDVSPERDGWSRIVLTGRGNESGNTHLQVVLYPGHDGTTKAMGDVLFGGGELRRVQ